MGCPSTSKSLITNHHSRFSLDPLHADAMWERAQPGDFAWHVVSALRGGEVFRED